MSDPPSYDQLLLDRLNALRKSSIRLDSSKPNTIVNEALTQESDLSARLRSLRNSSSSQPAAPKCSAPTAPAVPSPAADPGPPLAFQDDDDKTLEELLADLGPDDQWKLNPDDPADIQKLLNEAKGALPSNEAKPDPNKESTDPSAGADADTNKNLLTRDLDMSAFTLDDDGDGSGQRERNSKLEDESREAQDIVSRMLDEVNLERQKESKTLVDEVNAAEPADYDDKKLALPSAPSTLPNPLPDAATSASRKSLDFESDIAARMAALKGVESANELGLPSVPTFKPVDQPVKGVMKKYTDEEVDCWCIICQDDATVKCLGCDGDLYCAGCWKEGHMGPDVGWEERRHKWAKYKKPN